MPLCVKTDIFPQSRAQTSTKKKDGRPKVWNFECDVVTIFNVPIGWLQKSRIEMTLSLYVKIDIFPQSYKHRKKTVDQKICNFESNVRISWLQKSRIGMTLSLYVKIDIFP